MLTVSKVIAPHPTYTHDKNITSTAYPGHEVKMKNAFMTDFWQYQWH